MNAEEMAKYRDRLKPHYLRAAIRFK